VDDRLPRRQNNGTRLRVRQPRQDRPTLPSDRPTGKLDIPRHAGYWLKNDADQPLKRLRHVCWDGCMFPNEVMMKPQTWNDILGAMVKVRDQHGWHEAK
jgi:hypothetical protein